MQGGVDNGRTGWGGPEGGHPPLPPDLQVPGVRGGHGELRLCGPPPPGHEAEEGPPRHQRRDIQQVSRHSPTFVVNSLRSHLDADTLFHFNQNPNFTRFFFFRRYGTGIYLCLLIATFRLSKLYFCIKQPSKLWIRIRRTQFWSGSAKRIYQPLSKHL